LVNGAALAGVQRSFDPVSFSANVSQSLRPVLIAVNRRAPLLAPNAPPAPHLPKNRIGLWSNLVLNVLNQDD